MVFGGKAHKSMGAQDFSPQEFLVLMLFHTQPPASHQNYAWSVLTSLWLQQLLFQVNRSQLCLWICLSHQISGQKFALQPKFCDEYKKNVIGFQYCPAFSCCKGGSDNV